LGICAASIPFAFVRRGVDLPTAAVPPLRIAKSIVNAGRACLLAILFVPSIPALAQNGPETECSPVEGYWLDHAVLGGRASVRDQTQHGTPEECSSVEDANWQDQEKFVWRRLCGGAEANFNAAEGFGGDLDLTQPSETKPNSGANQSRSRIISPSFLAPILLTEKYRRWIPRHGIRIVGARFNERLELANAGLRHELRLENSLLEKGADLSGVRAGLTLSLAGSKIDGELNLNGARIGENLYLPGAVLAKVSLVGADVGGWLNLDRSKVTKSINMRGIEVGGNVLMETARLRKVNLHGARIGSELSLNGSCVAGDLALGQLQVTHDLHMRRVTAGKVYLTGTKVGGYGRSRLHQDTNPRVGGRPFHGRGQRYRSRNR
jgi:hypothetical protein